MHGNSAQYTITDWQGHTVQHGTLGGKGSGYDYTCLPDGCYTISVSSGSFPGEITWYYYDGYNNESGGAPSTQSFSIGTIVSGCTDPCASNYNPNANCPGPCNNNCNADLDGNGYVNIADLLIFTSQFGTYCN